MSEQSRLPFISLHASFWFSVCVLERSASYEMEYYNQLIHIWEGRAKCWD